MVIRFLGHASFLIEGDDGLKILLDPYEPNGFGGAVKYEPLNEKVDIVVISHEHADHCYISNAFGNPSVVKKDGVVRGITFNSVELPHDDKMGSLRGMVKAWNFEFGGIKFCHLGDVGAVLKKSQVDEIGSVDILFIPVGGTFTVGPDEAKKIVDSLSPKIAIPMHYKTPKIGFPLRSIGDFLQKFENFKKISKSRLNISKKDIPPSTEIWAMDYEK